MKSRFPVLCVIVCLMAQMGDANVVLLGNNLTMSFDDIEASFSPGVKGSGVNGLVYASEPLNACSPLTIKAVKGPPSPFALIVRGGCTFDEKVKNAQDAGFKAAIVYDNENSGVLVSMAGSTSGIHICAVFISKASGEVLKKFSGHTDVEPPVSTNQHKVFVAPIGPFWAWIAQSTCQFTLHLEFWVWFFELLLSWRLQSVWVVPKAMWGIRAKPVYHGRSVATAVSIGGKCGGRHIISSVLAAVLPERLWRFGCQSIGHDVSPVIATTVSVGGKCGGRHIISSVLAAVLPETLWRFRCKFV
ncbi:unnamed protein product [Miscanthus lutarioriparius]|uniref:PA domain-containing protein n=1 Tax=Miscanthus lutarioriparius TaxID=422564 RepID=A0A811RAC3_9POAL|nr:unnamed protein product [Miscanthus lutarioriparius]